MKVGVLALQGDFREHIKAARECGHLAMEVRRTSELSDIDALILPGGESTTIIHLAQSFDLYEPIKEVIAKGLPVYGSCAGMILLADRIVGGIAGQKTFGGLDITVRRNAFGRQVDSFESDLEFNGASLHAVFIRAPWVEEVGKSVQVLSTAGEHAVAVREGNLLATSFHPELTHDLAVHRYFFDEICKGR
ncbi:pyridoxal 5'-phosphate synthase glutaminase subunit PdxT [Candidatus Planktophila dulcis]|uniref:pyridoxal 5'-phosphate synthase glutaminase subunit PdxT n=1 Tax=Candidatus Planktophila dulcis TaxID=1884914 RepID=UPI003CE81228